MMDHQSPITRQSMLHARKKSLWMYFLVGNLICPNPLMKFRCVIINSHLWPRIQKSSPMIQDKLHTSIPLRLRGRSGSHSCSWRKLCRIFPAFKFSWRAASNEWPHGDWRVNINSVSGTRLTQTPIWLIFIKLLAINLFQIHFINLKT